MTSRTLTRRFWGTFFAFISLLATSRLVLAQEGPPLLSDTVNEPTVKVVDPPPKYHRVFIDSNRLADYPTRGRRFLPIFQAEFDRLLRTSWTESIDEPHKMPRIDSALLTASLNNDRVLEGTAQLDVVFKEDEPRLLYLALGRVSARNVEWVSENGGTRRAFFGTFGTDDNPSECRQAVVVEAAGTLAFSWSNAGRLDSRDTMHFDLPQPPCHRKHLVLNMPAAFSATANNGVVMRSSSTEAGRRTSEIALGGRCATSLQIRDTTSQANRGTVAAVRQSLEFDVDEQGTELEAVFQFAWKEPSIDRLWLECGQGVHVFQVFVNGSQVKWTNHRGAAGDVVEIHHPVRSLDPTSIPTIPSPDPLAAAVGEAEVGWAGPDTRPIWNDERDSVSIKVQALVEHSIEQAWRLPSIRIGETLALRSSVMLHVAPTLDVEQIEASGAVQTSPEGGNAPGAGWRLAFEERSPDAAITITLNHRTEQRKDQIISVVTLGEREAAATAVVDVTTGGEVAHVVTFPVGDRWVIDTVESVPDGSLRDWFVRRVEDRHRLLVYPTKSISSDRPLQIVVSGRRYGSTSAGIPPSGLRLLAPPHEAVAQERLFVRPVEDRGLLEVAAQKSGEGGPPALGRPSQSVQLPPVFGAVDDRLLFPIRLDSTVGIALESEGPQLVAQIQIDATVKRRDNVDRDPQADDDDSMVFHESLDIECTPQGTVVREMTVDLSGAAGADVTWRLASDGELLTAKRMEQTDSSTHPHIDRWLICLPVGQSEPFHLHGHFELPYADRAMVAFAALKGFGQQRGRVDVHRLIGRRFHVLASGVNPIPSPPGDFRDLPTSFRSFEYDPANLVSLGGNPPRASLSIQLAARANSPDARTCLVHQCRLDTALTDDGSLHHAASLILENAGDDQFVFRLPSTGSENTGDPAAVIESIAVDGRTVPLPMEGQMNNLVVDLPPGRQFLGMRIHYVTRKPAIGWHSRIQMTWPSFDAPVYDWQSFLYLPPSFEAPGSSWATPSFGSAMMRRLFGPFTRHHDGGAKETARVWPLEGWAPTDISDRQRHTNTAAADNMAGWTRCRIPKDGSLTIVRRSHRLGLAVVSFFAAAALVAGALLRRAVYVGIFASATVCAALLLPNAFAPIATAALFGGISVWLGRSFAVAVQGVFRTSPQPTAVVLLAAFAFGAIGSQPGLSSAAEPPGTNVGSSQTRRAISTNGDEGTHEVLIPIDGDRQPSSDKVLISDHFYRMLLDRARESRRIPGDWAIERAHYSGRLPNTIGDDHPGAWSATFDVVTYRRDATVRIPIAKEDATWNRDATLDGTRIDLHWSPDGMNYWFVVPEPGRYQIELGFVPKIARIEGAFSIDMRVPQVTDATISLGGSNTEPLRAVSEIEGGAGQRSVAGGHETVLENVDRLRIRWQATQPTLTADRLVVESFHFLHVTPEATRIDVMFRITTDEKRLDQILVKTPDHWRFAEAVGGAAIASIEPDPVDPSSHRVRFAEPNVGMTDVVLKFDVLDENHVGQLHFGHAVVLDAPAKQSHWGVRLDPRLQLEPPTDASVSPERPESFINAWPETVEPPQVVYLVPNGKPLPLAVWPRPVVTRARESNVVTLAASRNGTIEFHADVELQEGECFGHTIQVPATVHVKSVQVVQNDNEHISRWVQNESGHVNLLVKAPLRGRHSVVLKGSWYEESETRSQLPVVRLVADNYESAHLVVQRNAEAAVAILDSTGVEAKKLTPNEDGQSNAIPPPNAGALAARHTNIVLADFQYESRQGYVVNVDTPAPSTEQRTLPEMAERQKTHRKGDATEHGSLQNAGTAENDGTRERIRAHQPQVVLADLTTTSHGAIDAQFLLLAANASEIGLKLPKRCVPTFFDLAGSIDAVKAVGLNCWRIELSSATSPVLLRVHYQISDDGIRANHSAQTRDIKPVLDPSLLSSRPRSARAEEGFRGGAVWSRARTYEFECPVLLWKGKPIPIRQTIWTVTPPDRSKLRPSDPALAVTADQIAVQRWRSLIQSVRAVEPFARQLAPDLRRDWFVPWGRRLAAAEMAARAQLAKSPSDADLEQQAIRTTMEVTDFLERLELTAVYQSAMGNTPELFAAVSGLPLADVVLQDESRHQFFAYRGTGTLAVEITPGSDSFVRRFAAAVLFVLITCGMVPISRLQTGAGSTTLGPYLAFVAFGGIWWFCLAPQWIGPAIAFFLLVAHWRGRRRAANAPAG